MNHDTKVYSEVVGKSDDKWKDNAIQFPRLIAELEAVGAFTPAIFNDLAASMDLESTDIVELIDRAQAEWDAIKAT